MSAGCIPLVLPESVTQQRAVLRECINYIKQNRETYGIYGICKHPSMPALYTDVINQLLANTTGGRAPYLSLGDGTGFRLQLIPVNMEDPDKEESECNFIFKYNEVEQKLQTQTKDTLCTKRRRED